MTDRVSKPPPFPSDRNRIRIFAAASKRPSSVSSTFVRKAMQEIADLIRQLEIDIVVDLNGLSGNGRPSILARRPAPIQVNYLGYPGTMGTAYHDYIFADATVMPPEHFGFYSEKVAWLPDSFYGKRFAAPHRATRRRLGSELDLPETGFVFCCFNQSYKIDPTIFDVWMRLLHAVERQRIVAEGQRCDGLAQSPSRGRAARNRARTPDLRAQRRQCRRPSGAAPAGRSVPRYIALQCPYDGERCALDRRAGDHLSRA